MRKGVQRHPGGGYLSLVPCLWLCSKGDIERAAAELAAARRLVGDNRYSSIAHLRTVESWGVPQIQDLVESSYFAGLRKAGVPETDWVARAIGGGPGPTRREGAGEASPTGETPVSGC